MACKDPASTTTLNGLSILDIVNMMFKPRHVKEHVVQSLGPHRLRQE